MSIDPSTPLCLTAAASLGREQRRDRVGGGTRASGRPVVLALGDTHVLRVDKPLYDQNDQLAEQFTRVETFGNPNVDWVRVEADPRQPSVFTFHQQLIP